MNESRLEDQEREASRNKEFYDKNLAEYKDLCKKLSDTLEELTGLQHFDRYLVLHECIWLA